MDESEFLKDDSDKSYFLFVWRFFFVSCFFLLYLLYFLSADKSYLLNDEYDYDGCDSGYADPCSFPFRFDESVGRVEYFVGPVYNSVSFVSGVGYGGFLKQESSQLFMLLRWLCLY